MAINATATQQFVPIKEVRGGTIILKDGGLRSVVLASSINLSLKSSDEQMAIFSQFQAFLNSLDFSIQILIQSRKLDIRPYLAILEEREKQMEEPLMKIQTKEYMNFIKGFTESVNIMTKNFFLVVPFNPTIISKKKGIADSLFPKKEQKVSQEDFEEQRSQLSQRVGVVTQGLARIGIRSIELGTEEAIELLYKSFNIDSSEGILGSFEEEGVEKKDNKLNS